MGIVSRLLEAKELERSVTLVEREAGRLLERAADVRKQLDAAHARRDTVAEHLAAHRLARIARQLTRAQAGLVHTDDPRYAAAQAVIGFCDEADNAGLWNEPVPPVELGATA